MFLNAGPAEDMHERRLARKLRKSRRLGARTRLAVTSRQLMPGSTLVFDTNSMELQDARRKYSRQGIRRTKSEYLSLNGSGDYLFSHRIEDDFGRIVEIQLMHDMGAMRLDGVGAEV